jgi:GWxTD domain-containing protein
LAHKIGTRIFFSSRVLFFCRIFFFVFLLLPGCHFYNLERKLTPENEEFLSQVRYIITGEERKNFLKLPETEKADFRDEFWKSRDPDPNTKENEFKTEYFGRIETAMELFRGEGKAGWLTDRGRIYILFGPPTDRITYTMGQEFTDRCSETWYYELFPVIFYDAFCTGNFVLSPIDLTHLHYLNMSESRFQQTFAKGKSVFDAALKLINKVISPVKIEGIIAIDVPFSGIWFSSKNDGFGTILDVHLELKDDQGELIWEHKGSYEVTMSKAELEEKKKENFQIEVSFLLDQDLDRLRRGKNRIYLAIINRTGNEESKKVLDFIL